MTPGTKVRVTEDVWLYSGNARGRTGTVKPRQHENAYEVAVAIDGEPDGHLSYFMTAELETIE